MTLRTALAAPFIHSRTQKLGRSELIYYYAFDRRWMDRDSVDLLIRRGLQQGLLGDDGDFLYPRFDFEGISIPIGYKPSSAIFAVDDPVQMLIERIASAIQGSDETVVSAMNKLIEEGFDGNIRPEAALVILAKQYNVQIIDLLSSLRTSLKDNHPAGPDPVQGR